MTTTTNTLTPTFTLTSATTYATPTTNTNTLATVPGLPVNTYTSDYKFEKVPNGEYPLRTPSLITELVKMNKTILSIYHPSLYDTLNDITIYTDWLHVMYQLIEYTVNRLKVTAKLNIGQSRSINQWLDFISLSIVDKTPPFDEYNTFVSMYDLKLCCPKCKNKDRCVSLNMRDIYANLIDDWNIDHTDNTIVDKYGIKYPYADIVSDYPNRVVHICRACSRVIIRDNTGQ